MPLLELIAIRLADLVDRAFHAFLALLDPDGGLTEALDLLHAVANEKHRHISGIDEVLDAALALLLEEHVAHGERLVDDEDVGLGDGRDGEGDARNHAARIVLERHVHEIMQLGEVDDLVEMAVDELPGVSQESAVEVDVLARGKLHVEARAELDERRDIAAHDAFAFAGLQHSGDNLEHSRLAGTVGAHKAHDRALGNLEADVLECTELLEVKLAFHQLDEVLLQVVQLLGSHVEDHGDVVDFDGVFHIGLL